MRIRIITHQQPCYHGTVAQVVLPTARNQAAAQLEQLFAARGAGLYAMAAAQVQEDIMAASDLLREELGVAAPAVVPCAAGTCPAVAQAGASRAWLS